MISHITKLLFQKRMDQITKLPKDALYIKFDMAHYFPKANAHKNREIENTKENQDYGKH